MLQRRRATIGVLALLTGMTSLVSAAGSAPAAKAAMPMASTAATNPSKVQPLKVGGLAPAVVVRNPDGTDRKFDPQSLRKPAVLIFYRGGWCPYCNAHLGALKAAEPQLLKLGYDLYFLSADRPAILYSSLKEPDVKYTLLSDARMNAARAFGVAFRLDDATYAQYKTYGIDLEVASGEKHHELPVPAVFIIGTDGRIRFAHWNADYKQRLAAEPLLAAAKAAL